MTIRLLTDTGVELDNIPNELTVYPHWVVWKFGSSYVRHGKREKKPLQPHYRGYAANVSNPQTWTTFENALAYAQEKPVDGLGFVLSEKDPFVCIDLDSCFDGSGTLSSDATAIVSSFPPTFIERSHSGNGLHIWIRGTIPGTLTRKGKYEVYGSARYIAVTGDVYNDAPISIAPAQNELDSFYAAYIAKSADSTPVPVSPPQRPVQPPSDLVTRLLTASPGAIGEEIGRLWSGDTSDYANDHSQADYHLCRHIAFWTQNPAEVDAIFRQSGLYREKWERSDYREKTIERAVSARKGRIRGAENLTPVRPTQVSAGVAPEPIVTPNLRVSMLTSIDAKPISWLWDGWIARGMLSIIAGQPGEGKSTIASDLAATFSNGGHWPDGTKAPQGKTLMLLGEESPEYVLKPRLETFNANPDNIGIAEAVVTPDGKDQLPNLAEHMEAMEQAIVEHGFDLLIIDPVSSFLPRSNRNDEGAIRDLLTPVIKMAERTGCAVLAVMHLGKAQANVKRSALQQLLGSTGFGATARTVFMVSPMPADPSHKALGVVKSNLGVFPPTLEWSRDVDAPITWHGNASHQIAALIEGTVDTPRGEAGAWLKAFLADGPKPTAEVEEAAEAAGISKRTLERARKQTGVLAHRVNRVWQLTLPD